MSVDILTTVLLCTIHFVLSYLFTSTNFLAIGHFSDDLLGSIFVQLILYPTFQ